jgi:hypothetical protein
MVFFGGSSPPKVPRFPHLMKITPLLLILEHIFDICNLSGNMINGDAIFMPIRWFQLQ